MARVKTPLKLIGDYFVLDYWPESDTFQLLMDDGTTNTYDLGADLTQIRVMGKVWGVESYVFERALALAKNFRSVQVILEDGRVLPLLEREGTRSRRSPFAIEEIEHETITL